MPQPRNINPGASDALRNKYEAMRASRANPEALIDLQGNLARNGQLIDSYADLEMLDDDELDRFRRYMHAAARQSPAPPVQGPPNMDAIPQPWTPPKGSPGIGLTPSERARIERRMGDNYLGSPSAAPDVVPSKRSTNIKGNMKDALMQYMALRHRGG